MREFVALIFGFILCIQLCNAQEKKQLNATAALCMPGCGHYANCVATNICECFQDYVEENGLCVPVCKQDCGPHGKCMAPDKCGCELNYNWNPKLKRCVAQCSPPCRANEFCSEPDICACNRGYIEEKGVCQPICSKGCAHGRCVAPETCECSTGYEWHRNVQKCVPKCMPRCGSHSFCHRINECKCHKGYKPDDMKSLSCSLPLVWWVYLAIGLITIVIVCSVAGIIYYFVAQGRNVNYYPNTNFADTTQIVQ